MNTKKFMIVFLSIVMLTGLNDIVSGNQLTSVQILRKVDNVLNAPRDQKLRLKLVLVNKNGSEKTRQMVILQKGSDKRIAKFLFPASQKGIAFLSLPGDIMYLYLPAFKKIRRIASHVKNARFAGTDFSYEDMEAIRYLHKYDPLLLDDKSDNVFILQLNAKRNIKTAYLKIILKVRKDNYYPVKAELYNKKGKLFKIMTWSKIKRIQGYWIAQETEMKDLKKQHKTRIIIMKVYFNSGISEQRFSKRYLKK